jgi:Fe-S-cluster containining protein
LEFILDRKTPFSFACRACGRCCSGKIIMTGPHEVLGMARLLGISTTEFLVRYGDHGGTALRFGADGRCPFVSAEGCRVHPRRPLVCRLYPLGRATDGEARESFALHPKEEGCQGEFGTDGTIADFLESQGVAPYIGWAVRYGGLYRRMLGLLERLDVEVKIEASAAGGGSGGAGPADEGEGRAADRAPISPWQDVDASLADQCAARGMAVPEGIEDAIAIHVLAMSEWLDDLEARAGEDKGGGKGAAS